MDIIHYNLESELSGMKVISFSDWSSPEEILEAEKLLIQPGDSYYLFCEADATNQQAIQYLERVGYLFSEFRIKSLLRTAGAGVSTQSFYPYVAGLISEPLHLDQALQMLFHTNGDDRFSNDPHIRENFSRERVTANLRKSFHAWPKEFLLGIFNDQSGELVAFRSGAILSATEAHYYQYGVANGRDFDHTAEMLEVFTVEFLKQKGIELIHAVSTGFNIAELNRLISHLGFMITSSTVLLRKIVA